MMFDLLQSRETLIAIRDEWNALWARSHGDYYLGYSSCLLSWDTMHAPRGHRLCVAIARQDERLVAVLPMVTRRKQLWTIASTCGPEAAEGCDILQAQDASPDVGRRLLAFFMAQSRPDIISLPFVRAGNILDQAIGKSGTFSVIAQTDTMPYAILADEPNWHDYERSLSRGTQSQTARKRRRLDEIGAVTIEAIEGPADDAIDWLLNEKAKWGRKVDKIGPWLFSPQYRSYLKAYAAASEPASERVLTFTLKVDSRYAAVKVIAVGPSLCTLIIAAYDEELSRFSPGNILDEVWIRHVFDHCRDETGRPLNVNFGNGVERYKMHWGRGQTFVSHTYKLAATRWGEVPYRAKAAARSLAKIRERAARLTLAPTQR